MSDPPIDNGPTSIEAMASEEFRRAQEKNNVDRRAGIGWYFWNGCMFEKASKPVNLAALKKRNDRGPKRIDG